MSQHATGPAAGQSRGHSGGQRTVNLTSSAHPRPHMRAGALACIAVVGAILSAAPAHAQTVTKKPYDSELLRLSELLGAIHYLRALCGHEEGQIWRRYMTDLIDSEGFTAKRRLTLTQAFNKGYRSYQRTYRSCTGTAQTAVRQFLNESGTAAQKLSTFGDEKDEAKKEDAAKTQ
ncbi:MAG: TIGR02301 family protein [Pseudomonadota bacterium]